LLVRAAMRPSLFVVLLAALLACSHLNVPSAPDGSALDYEIDAASALSDDDAAPVEADGGVAPDPTWDASVAPADDAGLLVLPDASTPSEHDSDPPDACTRPLAPGDLVIDELMIESVKGTGDYGEWLEVRNTTSCAVNLNGLRGETPVGAKVHSFYITGDTWVPPLGTFVVADSADPVVNHDLPGLVLTWSGQPGDVLRNNGGTVTLVLGNALVTSLTWPALKPTPGVSFELPATCPPACATDFANWQPAQASWFPGFYGTPNAPNTDVTCTQG
jgi:hypothetical protein